MNPLNRVERTIEIRCFEMTKNTLKNFKLSFALVHLMFPYQHPVISTFNLFGNLEILRRSTLEQHLNIPIFNFSVNWEKCKSRLRLYH